MSPAQGQRAAWVVEVVLPLPLTPLSYLSSDLITPGTRVVVPLKGRKLVGIVWCCKELEGGPVSDLKPVEKILDTGPIVSEGLLSLLAWVSRYYFCPLGKVFKTALPPFFWRLPGPRTKGLAPVKPLFSKPPGYRVEVFQEASPQRRMAFYLQVLEEALGQGQSVLFLVPERVDFERIYPDLEKALGKQLYVYASYLAAGKRKKTWLAALEGGAKVFLGLRAAVFLPLRPGLIVVEKEASSSYWQEEGLLYQARNLALFRAQQEGSRVVLGGAFPSVASFYRASVRQYFWISPPKPSAVSPRPRIEIEDLSRTQGYLSARLLNAVRMAVAHRQKALLFLNRRGFAPVLRCESCGHIWECPHCGFSLTYHRQERLLRCHLCGESLPAPPLCPHCGLEKLRPLGAGTERLEEVLARLLPGVSILRVDRESMPNEQALARGREALAKTQIIVGTRLVRRLGPIPDLQVIGIVLADQGLRFPDYRAPERTLEVLTDLYELLPAQGRFIVQTFFPEHYVLKALVSGDFRNFYVEELKRRQALGFPPFGRLVLLELRGKNPEAVENAALKVRDFLMEKNFLDLLGPAPAPFYQKKGRFRWQILLKSPRFALLAKALQELLQTTDWKIKGVDLTVYPDPEETL